MEATESTTTETTALVTVSEEGRELVAFALTFLATAEAVKIANPEEAQAVVDQAKRAKECFKAVEEYRKTLTGPLDEQRKAIMDYFRPACDGLTRAEQLLKGAYSVWDAEQRRLAAVEAEKARKAQEAQAAQTPDRDRRPLSDMSVSAESLALSPQLPRRLSSLMMILRLT